MPLISMDLSELEGKLQSNQIALGAIQEDLIAANAVTKTKIADGSIETPKLAAGAVTASKIAARTITAYEIATGAITANEIAARTITAAEIATGAITANKIAANAITASKIQAGVISYDKLDVAYARVTQVDFGTLLSSASNQNDWNVFKLTFSETIMDVYAWHNALNTLSGNMVVSYSTNGGLSWTPELLIPSYSEDNYQHQLAGILLQQGYSYMRPNLTSFRFRKISGTGTELWVRFKRHSIS